MKTNKSLVEYAKAQLGRPYWYGTFGNVATVDLYQYKRTQYPDMYKSWSDFPNQYGQRVHDCVGLIKGHLWSDTPESVPKYVGSQDVSAYGMYKASTQKGVIGEFPYTNGALVYASSSSSYMGIHHVGVYCSDGYVYEAKGHQYGVVKTKFRLQDWQYWSLCPFITYLSDSAENNNVTKKSVEDIAVEVLKGLWDSGDARKQKLEEAGYNYREVQDIVNKMLGNTTSIYDAFIDEVGAIAQAEYNKRDKWLLPSVCIAQAALESGWNLNAQTLFGIKAKAGDESVTLPTQEFENGQYQNTSAAFKKYPTIAAAVEGYYDLITSLDRYKDAVNNPDAESTIKAIHAGGYATDPTYVSKVLNIVNTYNLRDWDTPKSEEVDPPTPPMPDPPTPPMPSQGCCCKCN